MTSKIQIASRRLLGQKGQEFIMFGLMVFLIYTPLLLGMFVMGMNMIVSIQVNNLARDLDNMYIHGTDFSTYGAQQLAQTLSNGIGLNIAAFGGGVTNQATPGTNSGTGNGIVWITQVMWVGATTDPLCQAALPKSCNANNFVYTQQIVFGNTNLVSQKDTSLGYYGGPGISSAGVISAPVTDATAVLGTSNQTAMKGLWQTSSNGQTSLTDGQTVYVVESFFQTPMLNMGTFYQSPGVYARYFF